MAEPVWCGGKDISVRVNSWGFKKQNGLLISPGVSADRGYICGTPRCPKSTHKCAFWVVSCSVDFGDDGGGPSAIRSARASTPPDLINYLCCLTGVYIHNSILLVVQYKHLKSCSKDFKLENLMLRTRLCGTGFIPQHC